MLKPSMRSVPSQWLSRDLQASCSSAAAVVSSLCLRQPGHKGGQRHGTWWDLVVYLQKRVWGNSPVQAYTPVLPGSRRRSGRRCCCQYHKRRTSASAPFQNSSQSQISWKTLDSGSSGSSLCGQTETTHTHTHTRRQQHTEAHEYSEGHSELLLYSDGLILTSCQWDPEVLM